MDKNNLEYLRELIVTLGEFKSQAQNFFLGKQTEMADWVYFEREVDDAIGSLKEIVDEEGNMLAEVEEAR